MLPSLERVFGCSCSTGRARLEQIKATQFSSDAVQSIEIGNNCVHLSSLGGYLSKLTENYQVQPEDDLMSNIFEVLDDNPLTVSVYTSGSCGIVSTSGSKLR